jgi:general secretion pathway protein G
MFSLFYLKILKIKLFKKRKHMKKGFSLIEIMIVIIILGLLAGLVLPNLLGQSEEAKKKIVCIQMQSINDALKNFKLQNGMYPSTEEGIKALVSNPDPEKYKSYPDGGFLDGSVPKDPWKNPYIFLNEEGTIEMISLGADGKEGGSKEASDIRFSTCKEK